MQLPNDELCSFCDRLQVLVERFATVKWVKPGTHRTLENSFAIFFDCKVTVLAVRLLTSGYQCDKLVIISILTFGTWGLELVSVEELKKDSTDGSLHQRDNSRSKQRRYGRHNLPLLHAQASSSVL